jgi:hypothetical protein
MIFPPDAPQAPLCVESKRDTIVRCEAKLGNHPDKLSKARWSWCYVSAVDSSGRTLWIVDANRGDGQRFIVHADEKLTAFVDLEAAIRYKYQNELFRPGRGIAKS